LFCSNLLCPAGVSLVPGVLTVRIYGGEDLPQTDYGSTKKKKDLVDPYCVVKFAGHNEETHAVPNCHDPTWNKEIRMAISVSDMHILTFAIQLTLASAVHCRSLYSTPNPQPAPRSSVKYSLAIGSTK
jgi:hypothetical protein